MLLFFQRCCKWEEAALMVGMWLLSICALQDFSALRSKKYTEWAHFYQTLQKLSIKCCLKSSPEVPDQLSLGPQEDTVGPEPRNGKENHGKPL